MESALLSDEKFKKNVKTIENALEIVNKLRGVYFTWNEKTNENGVNTVGFIAQEVEKVIPELVNTSKTGDTKLVLYSLVTALLCEAIKELSEKIEDNSALAKRVSEIESLLEKNDIATRA